VDAEFALRVQCAIWVGSGSEKELKDAGSCIATREPAQAATTRRRTRTPFAMTTTLPAAPWDESSAVWPSLDLGCELVVKECSCVL